MQLYNDEGECLMYPSQTLAPQSDLIDCDCAISF